MDAIWLHRYKLLGDEDGNVGIECRDHFDGGRPLAHYSTGDLRDYVDDPKVQNVKTIAGLLLAAEVHEHEMHGKPESQVVNVTVTGSAVSERELAQQIQRGIERRRGL
jgi:hypothetical protein